MPCVCSQTCTGLSTGNGSTGSAYYLLSSAVSQSLFALWFPVPLLTVPSPWVDLILVIEQPQVQILIRPTCRMYSRDVTMDCLKYCLQFTMLVWNTEKAVFTKLGFPTLMSMHFTAIFGERDEQRTTVYIFLVLFPSLSRWSWGLFINTYLYVTAIFLGNPNLFIDHHARQFWDQIGTRWTAWFAR